ncbi:MAG: HAD family hydrolase [Luminiphilus sp.]|jgi:FMN hydrolase / 5-amino-6-(5-phospho-D-ribitylamino)uracil phosphatase|nr:HAD family hydrolase [Luminiphilus sp.]
MNPASIRLITFDLDDTLWDVRPALVAAERAQWSCLTARFPSLALDALPREHLARVREDLIADRPELAHQISLFREVFIDRLLQQNGVSAEESAAAAREAFAAFLSHRHNVAVYDDARSVLTTLGRACKLGALTNGNANVWKTEIGDCFHYAWRAEEFGMSKPDPAFFHAAFERAGVTAGEVIHIGDCHDNDVSGAAAAGAQAIWFCPDGGVSNVAAAVVARLSELPDAIRRLTRGQQ